MINKPNKKVFPKFASMTWQELAVKQLLLEEDIPFVQQKKIPLRGCHVVVDFEIANKILLEVSATRMHRHGVSLKLKALQIEVKYARIRKEYPYQLWVLFESTRRVQRRLFNGLLRRLPSTDRLFTSRSRLRKMLQRHVKASGVQTILEPNQIYGRGANRKYCGSLSQAEAKK